MMIAILLGFIVATMLVWSGVIAWHMHTYVIEDDITHQRMFKAYIIGCSVFIVIILFMFAVVEWSALSTDSLLQQLQRSLEAIG